MYIMDVYIVGTVMSKFGILSNKSIKDLVKETVNGALLDANLSKTNLDAAFFSSATQSALQGQHMIPGQVALRSIGIEDIPVVNVENACASVGGFVARLHAFALLELQVCASASRCIKCVNLVLATEPQGR